MKSIAKYILLIFVSLNLFFIFQNCSQAPLGLKQNKTKSTDGQVVGAQDDSTQQDSQSDSSPHTPNVEFCDGSWSDCSSACGVGTQVYTSQNELFDSQNGCALKSGDTRACKLMECGVVDGGSMGGGSTQPACVDKTWTPAQDTVCSGLELMQSSDCGTVRKVLGSKNCNYQSTCSEKDLFSGVCANTNYGSEACWRTAAAKCSSQGGEFKSLSDVKYSCVTQDCSMCADSVWTPSESSVCDGVTFNQTSNCDRKRGSRGSKDCSAITCEDKTTETSCYIDSNSNNECIGRTTGYCKSGGGDYSTRVDGNKMMITCKVKVCNGVIAVPPVIPSPVVVTPEAPKREGCSVAGTVFKGGSEAASREAAYKCCSGYEYSSSISDGNNTVYRFVCK